MGSNPAPPLLAAWLWASSLMSLRPFLRVDESPYLPEWQVHGLTEPGALQSRGSLHVTLTISARPLPPPSPPPSPTPTQDLIADLKYELTGKFERLIVGLMRPLAYCDAKEIKDAIAVRSTGLRVCCEWGCAEWEDSGLCHRHSLGPAPTSSVACCERQLAQTLSRGVPQSPPDGQMWDRCWCETDLIRGALGPDPNTAAYSPEEAGSRGVKTSCARRSKAKGVVKEGRPRVA